MPPFLALSSLMQLTPVTGAVRPQPALCVQIEGQWTGLPAGSWLPQLLVAKAGYASLAPGLDALEVPVTLSSVAPSLGSLAGVNMTLTGSGFDTTNISANR